MDVATLGCDRRREGDVVSREQHVHDGGQVGEQGAELDHLHLDGHATGIDARQVDEIVDQMRQVAGVLGDAVQDVALGRFERAEGMIQQQVDVPEHDVQRGSELV